jgi:nucleobase:cation symporter-1, NCS1 family
VVSSVIHAGDAIFGGFGTILIVLAFLGLLTITGLNFYGASLTLLSAYDSIKPLKATLNTRIVALVVVAVAATTIAYLASGDFLTAFGTFIHFLGLLFAPWTAINLIDFYFVRKTHYSIRAIFEPHGGIYGRWNWRGLLAYGLGFISMIPFTASASYEGPVAKALGGADISMIIGLLVGGAVYLLAYRSFDLEAERLAVDKADIGLDPDAPNGIPYAAVPHGKRK